jgi:hypothetical protein
MIRVWTVGDRPVCIQCRVVGDRVYFITVYVDDLLFFATQDELDRLKSAFTEEFW